MGGKGISSGFLSGFLWAIDAIILGLCLSGNSSAPEMIAIVSLLVIAIHDILSGGYGGILLFTTDKYHDLIRYWKQGDLLVFIGASFLGGPLGMSLYILSILCIGVVQTAMFTAIYPAMGVILSIFFRQDTYRDTVVIGMGGMAIALLLLDYTPNIHWYPWYYYSLPVLTTLAWSGEAVLGAWGLKRSIPPSLAVITRQLSSGMIYLCLACVLVVLYPRILTVAWNWHIALAAVAGFFSFFYYYRAIAIQGPICAMGCNITYSMWVIILSAMFLGDDISTLQIVACLILIVSTVIVCIPGKGYKGSN